MVNRELGPWAAIRPWGVVVGISPEDYGEIRVYSVSSSSGDVSSAKEETYRIALGAPSSSWVITNMDYHTIGVLTNKVVAGFADACAGSFSASEFERDLLKVPHSSLVEAMTFHAASVSAEIPSIIFLLSFYTTF